MIIDLENIICIKCNTYPLDDINYIFYRCNCLSTRYYKNQTLLAIDFKDYKCVLDFGYTDSRIGINLSDKNIEPIFNDIFKNKITTNYNFLSEIYKEILKTNCNLIFI